MNTLNKIVKTKLYHHVADVPDDIWDKIESRMPEKKNEFRVIWVLFAFFALFLSGIMTYGYFNNDEIKESLESSLVKSNEIVNTASGFIHEDKKAAVVDTKVKLFQSKKRVVKSGTSNLKTKDLTAQWSENVKTTAVEQVTEVASNNTVIQPVLEVQKIENILSNKTLKNYYKIVIPNIKLSSQQIP